VIDNPFAMVVLIVAIVFGARVLQARYKAGRHSPQDDQVTIHMQQEIDRLTQRVQVLERLVTDDDRKLANEIDRLRTDRRPGAY
jgi:hypothetical protein